MKHIDKNSETYTSRVEAIVPEESLSESQRFLSTLISNLPGYVYRCHEADGEWCTQFASEGIYELTGYQATDFLKGGKRSYGWLVHSEDRDEVKNTVTAAIRYKIPYQITYRIKTSKNDIKWVWEQGRGVYGDDGSLIATEGFITDITEKKLAEQEILKRQNELSILNHIGQKISKLATPSEILSIIYKMTGKLFDNRNFYIALYDENKNQISFPVYKIDGKTMRSTTRKFANGLTEYIIKSKLPLLVENKIESAFNTLGIEMIGKKSKSLISAPMMLGEKVIGVITLQDYEKEYAFNAFQVELLMTLASQAAITLENARLFAALQQELEEKNKTEIQLKASLNEKEILLQEVHHRVKNNLQIMASLLHLQSTDSKNNELNYILMEIENRLKAMTIIHNKLYTSADYENINFSDYITTLAKNLFVSYGINSSIIKLDINVEDVMLNIDTAIPCGLIINELISNSLKYAFPNEKKGAISINLKHEGENLVLTVKDDGVGFTEDFDINKKNTLGLKLVKTLSAQLDGTIEIKHEEGTEFRITFKELNYEKRT